MLLDVPYFKQDTGYSCGAASVEMLLRFFGIIASERQLMQELHTDRIYGKHHQPIIDNLTKHGLHVYVDTESDLDELL